MKIIFFIVVIYYLVNKVTQIFLSYKSNKKSNDKVIDVDFEELD